MNVLFSIDDIIGSLYWLEKNEAGSIYDSFVFDSLRCIYERFKVPADLYCICKDGERELANISSRWKQEFIDAGDRFRFGFHAYNMNSDYNEATSEEIRVHYESFAKEIKRITGHEVLSNTIRLHYFSGNHSVIRQLNKMGIEIMLTADDERVSYGLSNHEISILKNTGEFYDSSTNMLFYKTDFRIENTMNEGLDKLVNERASKKRICFFTHEHLLGDKKYLDRIYGVLAEVERRQGDVY